MPFYRKFKNTQLKIAHRGYREIAPENTIYAFQEALNGFDFIEIDTQLTKDNQWIVMHDDTLERTTNIEFLYPEMLRPFRVSDYTLKEILRMDTTSWFYNNNSYNGKKPEPKTPPTLKETLDFCYKNSMPLNIEIKDMPCQNINNVTNLLIKELLPYLDKVNILISSFNHNYLKSLKLKNKDINIALNMEYTLPKNIIDYIDNIDAEAIHIDENIAKKLNFDNLFSNNITVAIFTINDKIKQKEFYKKGIRAIFMDTK